MELLRHLNDRQTQAVQYGKGPLLVLAGAGSGKTRVITARIAYLIEAKRAVPSQILAVTFTNKAAQEMKERIEHLLGAPSRKDKAVTISTFHSLCAMLLRRHAHLLGMSWNFNILDEDDQLRLIRKLVDEHPRIESERAELNRLRHVIEDMKNRGMTPSQAHEQAHNAAMEEDAWFYEAYQRALQQSNCVDFGNLLLAVVEIFRAHPTIAHRYSEQWQYILVDEFQDTNPVQYELLHHLTSTHKNLTVVGDDDQSIYRWRGATVANLLSFESTFEDAEVVKLEQNYRSTQLILDAANQVISHNPRRHSKTLWTDRTHGECIKLYVASDDREEATYVAQKINQYIRDGASYHDIAILYRTNAQGRLFEEQLRRYEIPYQIVGNLSFYARQEIKDVLAYLKVALNPSNDVALLRVINTPTRGVGKSTITKLLAASSIPGFGGNVYKVIQYLLNGGGQQQHTLFDEGQPRPKTMEHTLALEELHTIKGGSLRGIKAFYEAVEAIRDDLLHFDRLSSVVRQCLDRINYWEYLERNDPERAEDKHQNVAELINAIEEFEAHEEEHAMMLERMEAASVESESLADEQLVDAHAAWLLQAFLERSALVETMDSSESPEGAVTLMTVHGAKGLEFDTVFLVGMEDKLFPSKRADSDAEALQEERRLAYVAITRAQNRLTMTLAKRRRQYGQFQYTLPSPFLSDIAEHCLELEPGSLALAVSSSDAAQHGTDYRFQYERQSFLAKGVDASLWEFDQSPQMQRGEYGRAILAARAHNSRVHEQQIDEFSQLTPVSWDTFIEEEQPRAREPVTTWAAPRKKPSEQNLVGATVSHSRFGIGEVIEASGSGDNMKLTIDFPAEGKKTIIRKFIKVLA